jgi:hypothetical protein
VHAFGDKLARCSLATLENLAVGIPHFVRDKEKSKKIRQ